jgi:hypothetical protein
LKQWGISKPIIVVPRAEALAHIHPHFWGYGGWATPERVFLFSRDEIAVYKPYTIRAFWGEFIEFQPFGKVCWGVRTNKPLPIAPASLLALCALTAHLVDVYSLKYFVRTYSDDRTIRELALSGATETLRIDMVIADERNARIRINEGEASANGTLGTVVRKLLTVLAMSNI